MLALSFLTDFRDIIIIVFAIVGLIALTLVIVFTALIGYVSWKLLQAARGTLREGVGPMLTNAQETARGVQGTTAFVSDSLVSPIIRAYGILSGFRRGLGVLTRTRTRTAKD